MNPIYADSRLLRISDQQRFRIGVPFLFQSCKQSVLSLYVQERLGVLAATCAARKRLPLRMSAIRRA